MNDKSIVDFKKITNKQTNKLNNYNINVKSRFIYILIIRDFYCYYYIYVMYIIIYSYFFN